MVPFEHCGNVRLGQPSLSDLRRMIRRGTSGGRIRAAAALLFGLSLPSTAFAAGGAEDGDNLSEVVGLLVVVGVAYLITDFLVERLQRRLLAVSGLEYMVLGVLLGPLVPQIRAFDDLTGLLPIIALAAGWFGILRGVELSYAHIKDAPTGTIQLALADDLIGGLFVAVPALYFFQSGLLGPVDGAQAWMSAGVLGCCGAVGSTEPIDVVKSRYHVEGKTIPLLRRAARLGDAIALFVFGILFCVIRQDVSVAPLTALIGRPMSGIEWSVLALLLGAGLGFLFRFFLAGDESENGRFLALVGIVSFAAGAAWFLDLSSLMLNLVLGAVIVNTAKVGTQIRSTLERTQRPMTLVLLVFAGALWVPPPMVHAAWVALFAEGATLGAGMAGLASAVFLWVLLPPVALFVARTAGKALGSRLASTGQTFRPDLFRGLLGMGDVTVAMAISFRLVYEGAAVEVAYTTILGSVVLHDLVAPRLLRSLLVDSGELRREQKS